MKPRVHPLIARARARKPAPVTRIPVGRPRLPDLLTPDEVAEQLRVGRRRVYDLCRDGHLAAVKLGSKEWRIPVVALAAYIERHTQEAAS